MSSCRICSAPLTSILDFGRMPLADAFVAIDGFASEHFYHLEAALCERCGMVQLAHDVARERMFHADYAFFSSTSKRMVDHFQGFARWLIKKLDRSSAFVVEVGSNDGSMLEEFARAGVRHLGVDPAANVVRAARERGLQALCAFFEEETASKIAAEHGPADAIVATNCMCHIPYADSVLEGVRKLLRPDGLFVFEDPYLPAILDGRAFDQFYDEHTFYFSVTSVANMVSAHGFDLVAALPQPVHGGSMRYVVSPRGAWPRDASVDAAIDRERERGLTGTAAFSALRSHAEHVRIALPRLLGELRASGKTLVGYAATAKSATVLNYARISSDLLPLICDTTPTKHGRYTPGTHIPVRPYEEFVANPPDYALLFAWNHAAEILEKERAFRAGGGHFIVYVPELRVIAPGDAH